MSGATISTLDDACSLAEQGVAVHWLRPHSKAPIADNWASAPIATPAELRSSWRDGLNVGIRLGESSKVSGYFLHAIDLDIRDAAKADEARPHLQRLLPELDTLPFVVSGSGGASRHFYFLSDRPFRSRKLAHSSTKFTDAQGKTHWHWEIELFGSGKQVAAPPSIHPDTGNPYTWGTPIPFDILDLGLGPIISAKVVMSWGLNPDDQGEEEDELLAEAHRQPLGLKDEVIQKTLDDLPYDQYGEDRELWLIVGMALHHESEGSERGLDFWKAFSKKSAKYDPKDIRRVWDSFNGRLRPVRFPTLIKAAGIARLERHHEEADAFETVTVTDPEVDDLLGPPTTPKAKNADDIDVIGTAPVNPGTDWKRLLDLNEDGVIKPTSHNVELIVRHDPRSKGLPRFNIFKQQIVQRKKPGVFRRKGAKPTVQLDGYVWDVEDRVNGDLWIDVKDHALRAMIEAPKTQGGYGIKVTDRDLRLGVALSAHKNSFHPVREYLNGLRWDGKKRVETLFIRYLGVEDNAYGRMTALLTLIAAVARIYEPGHKFDFVNIFEGMQGKAKTTFIQTLAKGWFVGITARFDDIKAMVEQTQGRWICELPELSSMGRSSIEDMKACLSSQSDVTRLAYDHRAHEYKRQWIPFGSTNKREYLLDEENRRFWPQVCRVKLIDLNGLRAELDQLWAEAVVRYLKMREQQPHGTLPLFLTGQALEQAKVMQDSRHIESPAESLTGELAELLNQPVRDPSGFDDEDDLIGEPIIRDVVCLKQIWVELLGRDPAYYRQPEAQMLGKAMNAVPGWENAPAKERVPPYGWQRVWRRKREDRDE